MLNLIMNSIDAMAGVRRDVRALRVRCFQSSESVVVQVEDTGTGLDPVQIDSIFQPFFTTKAHGIGMGLSISRSIIEAHGGCLWAEPGPSGGALFQFSLPVASGAP